MDRGMAVAAPNYGGTQTTRGTLYDERAAQTKDPTHAEQTLERLRQLRDGATQLAARIDHAADRALGAIPQPGGTNGGVRPTIPGTFGQIGEMLDEINHILGAAHDSMQRLERAV